MVTVIVSIALSACYALGAFGDGGSTSVENQEFLTGDFTYSGEMKLGLFNGNGTIDFHNGEMLVGNFIDGRLDGEGVFYSNTEQLGVWRFSGLFGDCLIKSGTIYLDGGETIEYRPGADANALIGRDWQYDGFFGMRGQSGAGVFTFKDGSAYSGGFANGLADGEGTYSDPSGRIIYAGGFKNGKFDGQGSYFSPDGWSYEGCFKDGLLDGQGSYFSPDGWSYEGYFKDGKFDGDGAIITDAATIRGIWAEGVQVERHE